MTGTDAFSLEGKVAIVTGASHGIGEGVAKAYAAAGADVAIAARNVDDLNRVAGDIAALGRRVAVIQTDVSDLDIWKVTKTRNEKSKGDPTD